MKHPRHLSAVPDDPHPDEPEREPVPVPDPPKPPHAPDLGDLLYDIGPGNPYYRKAGAL